MSKNFIDIPFGASDSELRGFEYTIPEGMEAEIKDGKVIIRQKETEDERIRKSLLYQYKGFKSTDYYDDGITFGEVVAYLEKQKDEAQRQFNLGVQTGREEAFYEIEKQKEQKPAEWSGEDELFLGVCKNALSKYERSDKWDASIISAWLENRLKSLRPQPHWKPSEEQMQWLESAVKLSTDKSEIHGIIISLYEQLKRL